MKRVCVIGCPGAGKSSFANRLADLTGLPLLHLDTIFYEAGWANIDQPEFDDRLSAWLEKDRWIIDGNYKRTLGRRIKASDTVFFLDFPTFMCFNGAVRRLFEYHGQCRPDMAKGCHEKFDLGFFLYILRFRRNVRSKVIEILDAEAQHCNLHVFKNRRDVKRYLENYETTH